MLPKKQWTPADFVDIARRRWALIVAPPIVGLFVALVYSSALPNIYEAESLIQVVPQRVPDSFVQSTVTIRTEDRIGSLRQQVESRAQLERIILDLDLYAPLRASMPMQDVVDIMRSNITLDLLRLNRMEPVVDAFYLRFKYTDPAMAARVTERLGSLFVQYNAKERGALAEGANKFLEAQLSEATARLEEQEKRLQAFRERNAGRLPTQLDSNMQAIQATQMQRQSVVESLARDRDRKLVLEQLYNDAVATPAPAPPAAPQNPADPAQAASMSPRQQLEVAKSSLARLELRLKEDHPDLRRARKQVADLEKQVASLPPAAPSSAPAGATADEVQRQNRLATMRAEIESLTRQIQFKESEERRLDATIAQYQGRIEAIPGVESQFVSLTREYSTLQEQFRNLLQKSESAKVSADLENRQIGEQFRTLDPPRVPLRPVSPKRPFISGGGLAGGLVLGLLLIGVLELRDGSFKTEDEIVQVLGLPVLAAVPTVVTQLEKERSRLRRWMLVTGVGAVTCVGGYVAWSLKLWSYIG